MNEQQILAILAKFGVQALQSSLEVGVEVLIIQNPAITDDEILSEDEGTIKHTIRRKIGWLVDLIWPSIQSYIDNALRQAIATVRSGTAQQQLPLTNP